MNIYYTQAVDITVVITRDKHAGKGKATSWSRQTFQRNTKLEIWNVIYNLIEQKYFLNWVNLFAIKTENN